MTKRLDPDIKTILAATRALQGSSSHRMLRAHLAYLWDRFVMHPNEAEQEMFRKREERHP
jgi:hypothetical protein